MQFSNRTVWSLEPNRLARRIEALTRAGTPLLDLTDSNPTTAGFAHPPEALREALCAGALDRYEPHPQGMFQAREALCRSLRPLGIETEPSQLFLTASTSEAYSFLFKLLCEPGSNVLVPRPCYPLLEDLARLEGVELRPYSLELEAGWAIRFDDLTEVADRRTRAVLVVNPGNPTGTFLRRDEHARLIALCARNRWSLISDEVFAQYSWTTVSDVVRFAAGGEPMALTFSLSGLSKLAALPQLKLGWMAINGPPAKVAEAVARLEQIADAFLSVATPVQLGVERLMQLGAAARERILERVLTQRRKLIASRRSTSPWSVVPSEAGWTAVLRLPREPSEEELALRLVEAGVIVQPGYFYDFPRGHFLVLSLLTAPEVFDRALPILVETLDRL